MRLLLLLSLGLLGVVTAFAAEQPFFQIDAHYEGVDPTSIAVAGNFSANQAQSLELRHAVVRGGQYANLNMGDLRSVLPGEAEMTEIFLGITLEVKPVFNNGKTAFYGKSVVRRAASSDDTDSSHVQTFVTRESYFWREFAAEEKPLTIKIGDDEKGPARIVLTVKQIDEAEATRLMTPKFRVYAIEPTGEEAKKPVYQKYDIVPKSPPEPGETFTLKTVRKEGGYGMMIFVHPYHDVPYSPTADDEIARSLRELSPDEQPIKVSGSVSARDNHNVDIKVESTGKYEPKFSTGVTLRWGSAIFLALEDKTKPTGTRMLIIQQE